MVKNLQQDGQAPEWFHPSYWVPLGWMLLRICKVVIGQDLRPRPGKVPEGSAIVDQAGDRRKVVGKKP